MSRREPKLLLGDILDSVAKILNYTDGLSYEDFSKDSKTVDAVIRNFEIIGDAACGQCKAPSRPCKVDKTSY